MINVLRLTLLIIAIMSTGCPDPTPSNYPTEPVSLTDARLGPGDMFEIRIYKHEKMSGVYRVSSEGTITFPYLGTFKVEGQTPAEVERAIRDGLADGYLVDPYVSVLVKEYASKKISVFGFVKKPGTLSFTDNMTIVDAISQAGGFAPRAHPNATRVTRNKSKSDSKNYIVPVEKIGEGDAPNFYVRPGDYVYVPKKPWQ